MTEQHPITPPPELIEQWMQAHSTKYDLARHAAQWGADQELKACCEWLEDVDCEDPQETAKHLRAARRPKPPSLKQDALSLLAKTDGPVMLGNPEYRLRESEVEIIRRALEALDD
jgi:hypothetical protein